MAAISLSVLALCMIATIGFWFYVGVASDPLSFMFNLPFIFWSLYPYTVFAGITWAFRRRLALSLTLFFGILMVSGLSMVFLYDTLVAHPDPLNGIVWLVLPGWQLAGVGLTSAAVIWIDRSSRKAEQDGVLSRGLPHRP